MKKYMAFLLLVLMNGLSLYGGKPDRRKPKGGGRPRNRKIFHLKNLQSVPNDDDQAAVAIQHNLGCLPSLQASVSLQRFLQMVQQGDAKVDDVHEREQSVLLEALARNAGQYRHPSDPDKTVPKAVHATLPFMAAVMALGLHPGINFKTTGCRKLYQTLIATRGSFAAACLRLKLPYRMLKQDDHSGVGSLLWRSFLLPLERKAVDGNLKSMSIPRIFSLGQAEDLVEKVLAERIMEVHDGPLGRTRDPYILLGQAGGAQKAWTLLLEKLAQGGEVRIAALLSLLHHGAIDPNQKLCSGNGTKKDWPIAVVLGAQGQESRTLLIGEILSHPSCKVSTKNLALAYGLEQHDHDLVCAALQMGSDIHQLPPQSSILSGQKQAVEIVRDGSCRTCRSLLSGAGAQ